MTNLNDLSINLQRLMLEANISSVELSKRINIPTDTIKKIKAGKNINPTIETLKPIAEYFKISVSQLIGDYNYLSNKTSIKLNNKIDNEILNIPVITWEDALNCYSVKNPTDYCTILGYKLSKSSFALKIDNNNYGIHRNGELIFVDPEMKPIDKDYLLVHKIGAKIPDIKKLLIHEDIMYLQVIIYDTNHTIELTQDYKILGVLVGYEKFSR
jgi:transcriptional regulator with XRE-family HTH domain